jgi:hypothetical protein
MPALDVTVGGATSNSFASLAEAATYFDQRIPLPTPWVASGDASARALIMAARVLDGLAGAHRTLHVIGDARYYQSTPRWTGAPATATQRMTWPRTGMFDRNGNPIAEDAIPLDLKNAQAELAGQLLMTDTTLDNSVSVGGITNIKAGSVSLSFNEMIARHVIPDGVAEMLVPSWLTDALVEPAYQSAMFDVVSER